jgi:hypothetical protein
MSFFLKSNVAVDKYTLNGNAQNPMAKCPLAFTDIIGFVSQVSKSKIRIFVG